MSLAAISAGADEATFCNFFITSVPYTITTQGHYCLDRDITTTFSDPYGAAITIDSDFVVVDFNNFKLEGPPFIGNALARAVSSQNHRNIVVRNAVIHNFEIAIYINVQNTAGTPTGGGYAIVENNSLDQSLDQSINVSDQSSGITPLAIVIRNNRITRLLGAGQTAAIVVEQQGEGLATVANNVIAGATNTSDYPTFGVLFCADGGSYSIEHNLIVNLTGPTTYGVFRDDVHCQSGGVAVCRDNTVPGPVTAAYTNCLLVGHNDPPRP